MSELPATIEVLPEVPVEAAPALPAPRPPLRALHAWLAFGLLLGVQVFTGIGYVIYVMVTAVIAGDNLADGRSLAAAMAATQGQLLLFAGVMSAAAMLLALRLWGSHLFRDRTRDGLGFFVPPRRQTLAWAAAGAIGAALYVLVATLFPPPHDVPLGPLSAAAKAGGSSRLALVVLALLLAPPVEETLFRGLMLKGFAVSWGTRVAATLVTVLFVLMHLGETFHYWPATLAITLLGTCAALARIQTGSLVPAVAAHFAWNAVAMTAVYLGP